MNISADVENTAGGAGGASDETFGGVENHVDGNKIISVNFAPVNTNQQNFINVNSKIDFNAKVRFFNSRVAHAAWLELFTSYSCNVFLAQL